LKNRTIRTVISKAQDAEIRASKGTQQQFVVIQLCGGWGGKGSSSKRGDSAPGKHHNITIHPSKYPQRHPKNPEYIPSKIIEVV